MFKTVKSVFTCRDPYKLKIGDPEYERIINRGYRMGGQPLNCLGRKEKWKEQASCRIELQNFEIDRLKCDLLLTKVHDERIERENRQLVEKVAEFENCVSSMNYCMQAVSMEMKAAFITLKEVHEWIPDQPDAGSYEVLAFDDVVGDQNQLVTMVSELGDQVAIMKEYTQQLIHRSDTRFFASRSKSRQQSDSRVIRRPLPGEIFRKHHDYWAGKRDYSNNVTPWWKMVKESIHVRVFDKDKTEIENPQELDLVPQASWKRLAPLILTFSDQDIHRPARYIKKAPKVIDRVVSTKGEDVLVRQKTAQDLIHEMFDTPIEDKGTDRDDSSIESDESREIKESWHNSLEKENSKEKMRRMKLESKHKMIQLQQESHDKIMRQQQPSTSADISSSSQDNIMRQQQPSTSADISSSSQDKMRHQQPSTSAVISSSSQDKMRHQQPSKSADISSSSQDKMRHQQPSTSVVISSSSQDACKMSSGMNSVDRGMQKAVMPLASYKYPIKYTCSALPHEEEPAKLEPARASSLPVVLPVATASVPSCDRELYAAFKHTERELLVSKNENEELVSDLQATKGLLDLISQEMEVQKAEIIKLKQRLNKRHD